MKTILNIGYLKFLVPPSANVNALIAILGKSTLVKEEKVNGEFVFVPDSSERHCNPIRIELVDDSRVLEGRPKRKAIAQHASPDAHNTFGS